MANKYVNAAFKLDMSGLSIPTRLVLLSLADRANESGYCWCGHRDVMERTNLGERTVSLSLKELETAGIIKRNVGNNLAHKVSEYWLQMDAMQVEGSDSQALAQPATPAQYAGGSRTVCGGGGAQYAGGSRTVCGGGAHSMRTEPSLNPPNNPPIEHNNEPVAPPLNGIINIIGRIEEKKTTAFNPDDFKSDVRELWTSWNDFSDGFNGLSSVPVSNSGKLFSNIAQWIAAQGQEWRATWESVLKHIKRNSWLQNEVTGYKCVSLDWLVKPNAEKGTGIERILKDSYRTWDKEITGDLNPDGSQTEESMMAAMKRMEAQGVHCEVW